jgi:hypothetical protein
VYSRSLDRGKLLKFMGCRVTGEAVNAVTDTVAKLAPKLEHGEAAA